MAQQNIAYYRAAGVGAWAELAYTPGNDFGAFWNSLMGLLPTTGGEVILGPSSTVYRVASSLPAINKPVRVICAPGAVIQMTTSGGGNLFGAMRVTSAGAGTEWIGGRFEDASNYAMNVERNLFDIQAGAHDVHLRDVEFSIANLVAAGQECNAIKVTGTSGTAMVSGALIDGCRFLCDATREATVGTDTEPIGWTCIRMEYAVHAKVRNCTFTHDSPENITSAAPTNIRGILAMHDSLFCSFTGNSGYGLIGLADEHYSGATITGSGTECGLVTVAASTTEGHHFHYSDNFFEVMTGWDFVRLIGGAYGSVHSNTFGRMSAVGSVVRLANATQNIGQATSIQGNRWHNISGPSTLRNTGYCVWMTNQANILLDSSHFTLLNKQGDFNRIPIRVDNGCRDIVIGSVQAGFNNTSPFSYVVWEGPDAMSGTKLLFPTLFPEKPFVVQ